MRQNLLIWALGIALFVLALPTIYMTAMQVRAIFTVPGEIAEMVEADRRETARLAETNRLRAEARAAEAEAQPPAQQVYAGNGRRAAEITRQLAAAPDALFRAMSADLTFLVRAEDFAQPGEAAPEGVMGEVFVEARGVGLAERICARLTESLAAQCFVDGVEARAVALPEGPGWRLKIALAATRAGAFGDVPTGPVLVFDDDSGPRTIGWMPFPGLAQQEAMLFASLSGAEARCGELRAGGGTCAITRIWVEAGRDETRQSSEILRMRVATVFARLAVPGDGFEPDD